MHREPRDDREDKYAVVISHLPFKVVRRIPRTLATKDKPYTVLKVLVVKETDLSDYQRSEKLSPAWETSVPPSFWPVSTTCSQFKTANATASATSFSPGCLPSPEPSW